MQWRSLVLFSANANDVQTLPMCNIRDVVEHDNVFILTRGASVPCYIIILYTRTGEGFLVYTVYYTRVVLYKLESNNNASLSSDPIGIHPLHDCMYTSLKCIIFFSSCKREHVTYGTTYLPWRQRHDHAMQWSLSCVILKCARVNNNNIYNWY